MVNIEANSIQLVLGHIIKNPERENDIKTASISYNYLDHNSIFKKRSSIFFLQTEIQVKVFKTLTFMIIFFNFRREIMESWNYQSSDFQILLKSRLQL